MSFTSIGVAGVCVNRTSVAAHVIDTRSPVLQIVVDRLEFSSVRVACMATASSVVVATVVVVAIGVVVATLIGVARFGALGVGVVATVVVLLVVAALPQLLLCCFRSRRFLEPCCSADSFGCCVGDTLE